MKNLRKLYISARTVNAILFNSEKRCQQCMRIAEKLIYEKVYVDTDELPEELVNHIKEMEEALKR